MRRCNEDRATLAVSLLFYSGFLVARFEKIR